MTEMMGLHGERRIPDPGPSRMSRPLGTLSQPVGGWLPLLYIASEEIPPGIGGYIVGEDPENGL